MTNYINHFNQRGSNPPLKPNIMRKTETLMRSITIIIMVALATLVTYNVVAHGTTHDELYITH